MAVDEITDVETRPDGIILTKVDYPSPETMVWTRDKHPVDISRAQYHPETTSLIKDASPWFFYTPSPDASEDTHLRFSYPILQNGVSANEVAEHFVSSADVFDAGLDPETGVFQILLDSSVWWRQTEWTRVSPPYFPLWLRLDQEVLVSGLRLACTVPKDNDLSWHRFALPVFAGSSAEVHRSGNDCYLISLESDLACGDRTLSKYKLIKLSSPSVTVTPTEDTILLKVYR